LHFRPQIRRIAAVNAPAPRTPVALEAALCAAAGDKVLLALTDNLRQVVSFRRLAGGTLSIRADRAFLAAPDPVVAALGRLAAGDEGARGRVRSFVRNLDRREAAGPVRPLRLQPCGRVYDLEELGAVLNRTLLENRSRARLTWGRAVTARRTRSVRLGWYDVRRNLITLSRRLDAPEVPRFFVEYVLFHEMLHEILGIGERADGKRKIHGPTFRLLEQTFPGYERARLFEQRRWGG